MNWFKHDSDATTDSKIKKLIIRYGAIGYAIYFHCLELIASNVSETNITFELEHDAEIIADDLRIRGDATKSGTEIVEEIMRYMISLDLFEENNGHIFCFKLLKRLDTSMTSNTKMRAIISEAKKKLNDPLAIESQNHDKIMINHDTIMQEEIRREEIREDKNIYTSENSEEKQKKEKPTKHKYGEYQNVLLSDSEYQRFITEFGEEKTTAILNFYSEKKEMKGYKYKSDNPAIRNWGIRAYEDSLKGNSNYKRGYTPKSAFVNNVYTPIEEKPTPTFTEEELKGLPF